METTILAPRCLRVGAVHCINSRPLETPPERSAPGGEADEIGAKADIGARMTRAAILALVLALGPAVALASASAS